ncbi:MAG TPA: pyridoxamine 5'-phosphate oxidase family protein [Chthoniobacterales bacterium]
MRAGNGLSRLRTAIVPRRNPTFLKMTSKFLELTVSNSVREAQCRYYGSARHLEGAPQRDALTEEETVFIQTRDSFYMASVAETGWPYLQHRGGRPGFLRVLGPQTLAFADYKGNRQMLSTGNLIADDRVALFLMDYPHRERLKILGRARIEDARARPELVERVAFPEERRAVERLFFIEIEAFDWNCPQYITPRYTLAEIEELIAPLKQRIAELEAKLTQGN